MGCNIIKKNPHWGQHSDKTYYFAIVNIGSRPGISDKCQVIISREYDSLPWLLLHASNYVNMHGSSRCDSLIVWQCDSVTVWQCDSLPWLLLHASDYVNMLCGSRCESLTVWLCDAVQCNSVTVFLDYSYILSPICQSICQSARHY